MKSYFFREVAISSTRDWRILPAGATKAREIRLVCEDEATYCAELRPSSCAYWIREEFNTDEEYDEEVFHGAPDQLANYIPYISNWETTKIPHSRRIEIEVDPEDYDNEELEREDAWVKAVEQVNCNWVGVPWPDRNVKEV